jgi:TonB family protein
MAGHGVLALIGDTGYVSFGEHRRRQRRRVLKFHRFFVAGRPFHPRSYLRTLPLPASVAYDPDISAVPPALGSLFCTYRPQQRSEKVTNGSRRSFAASRWRGLRLCVVLLSAFVLAWFKPIFAQDGRKVKFSVQPAYPDLARKNNIQGSTRLQLAISADGSVKDIKVLGGNPVLVQASVEAVKKWKYEAASGESTALVKFDFKP